MQSALAPSDGEIFRSGKCERIVPLGSDDRIIRHKWRVFRGRGLYLTSVLLDKKGKAPYKKRTKLVPSNSERH